MTYLILAYDFHQLSPSIARVILQGFYIASKIFQMNSKSNHTFHIPVMGLAFTVDSPIKVARFGISSVLSLAEDRLIEMMRKKYSEVAGDDYQPIGPNVEDYRAKRITSYLNLVHRIVQKQFKTLQQEAFGEGNEIDQYFEMLPTDSVLRASYTQLLKTDCPTKKGMLANELRSKMQPGSIDVNIMTKLDKSNPSPNGDIKEENSDAVAALRGYALSELRNSSLVFSAGMNPRLFNYLEQFEDFQTFKKKVIVKVTDFRSALIQGKYLAKKGIWVSEFRIESGLNCGGHAFATDGYLLGPILEEFKTKKQELIDTMFSLFQKGEKAPAIKISVQGGIGTHEEDQLLHDYYAVDSTGWGSPFLLVPEATTVDEETMQLLAASKKEDIVLSKSSPLGIRFNYLKGTSGHKERLNRIKQNKAGSPCTEKHLAFNTEFTTEPICTASKKYIQLKLATPEGQAKKEEILAKECLCVGLSNSAAIVNKESFVKKLTAVTMCPGPNIANFSQIVSLKTMLDHIYGRIQDLTKESRPHLFLAELELYVNFLVESIEEEINTETWAKRTKYFQTFTANLQSGIEYYKTVPALAKKSFLNTLESMENELHFIQQKYTLQTIES